LGWSTEALYDLPKHTAAAPAVNSVWLVMEGISVGDVRERWRKMRNERRRREGEEQGEVKRKFIMVTKCAPSSAVTCVCAQ